MADEAKTTKNELVVNSAKGYLSSLKAAKYKMGGKSTSELDCSYFVYLVLHSVFDEYVYIDSTTIAQSRLFEKVSPSRPGDVIYFPPSSDTWWHDDVVNKPEKHKKSDDADKVFPGHVGIVINDSKWVGMQTSKGVGTVELSDPYFWGTRTAPVFYRYKGLKAADITHLQAVSAAK